MSAFFTSAAVLLLTAVNAQRPLANCSNVVSMNDFNSALFKGDWFVQYIIDNGFILPVDETCQKITYAVADDKSINIHADYLQLPFKTKGSFDETLTPDKADKPTKFSVKGTSFNTGFINAVFGVHEYQVPVSTDYQNYFIFVRCITAVGSLFQGSMTVVATRTRELTQEVTDMITGASAAVGGTDGKQVVDQSNCPN